MYLACPASGGKNNTGATPGHAYGNSFLFENATPSANCQRCQPQDEMNPVKRCGLGKPQGLFKCHDFDAITPISFVLSGIGQ
jgi:hypothetical protein